jgi:Mce-associated membrane protein
MLAGAVVLAAVGVVLLVLGPRGSSAPNNTAVVDRTSTAEVIGQVDTALQRVLSYKYSDPTATKTAAQQMLVGAALKQYNVLFAALQKKASGQRLTLSAKVVTAGVTFLQGNRAQLLVFLDQTSTRASDGKTSASAAQLQISAQRTHGSWLISNLVPL